MNSKARVVAVIPSRYGSSRFPGKPLVQICGKPMIQWVYEKALAAETISSVIIAVDDQRIADAVTAFGAKAVMTAPEHPSGTDRIAEAICGIEADLIVNLQGDEPLLPSEIIDRLVRRMLESKADMGTVAVPVRDPKAIADPNVVKVVLGTQGQALYFSRSPIPFDRDSGGTLEVLHHWGIYAYQPEFLEKFIRWAPGVLKQREKLEQLRALENGATIQVIIESQSHPDVNVPEDVARVEAIIHQQNADLIA